MSRATLYNWFERDTPPPSKTTRAKMLELLGEPEAYLFRGVTESKKAGHLKSGGQRTSANEEAPATYEVVASRIPQRREPSTRADCDQLFQRILDAAELSNDPNAFPAIYVHLQDGLAKKWPPPPEEPEIQT